MERLTHENSRVPSLCTIVQSCFAVAGNYRCESADCCACIDDDDDYAERHRVKTAVDWSPNDSNSSSPTDPGNHPLPSQRAIATRNIHTVTVHCMAVNTRKYDQIKNCEIQTSADYSSIRSMGKYTFDRTYKHSRQLLTPTTHYMVNCQQK